MNAGVSPSNTQIYSGITSHAMSSKSRDQSISKLRRFYYCSMKLSFKVIQGWQHNVFYVFKYVCCLNLVKYFLKRWDVFYSSKKVMCHVSSSSKIHNSKPMIKFVKFTSLSSWESQIFPPLTLSHFFIIRL